jgi:hypothetical protein
MERGRIVFVSAAVLTVAVLVGAAVWLAQPGGGGAIDVGAAPEGDGVTGQTGGAVASTSLPPETVMTTGRAPWPTAPGPGQLSDADVTATTEGMTTLPGSPGTLAPGETLPPEPPDPSSEPTGSTFDTTTVPATITEPPPPEAVRPAGPWVEDRVVVVAEGTVDGRSWSVGTYWTRRLGLCVGTNFDGSAVDGGYPVACRDEPHAGGGGASVEGASRVPGTGGVAAVFTPEPIDRATLDIGGTTIEGTLHRVDDFPEFTYAVFVLPGLDTSGALALDLPGEVALWLGDQPVGWG